MSLLVSSTKVHIKLVRKALAMQTNVNTCLPGSPVGKKVKSLKEGDRVAMEPGATCRVCEDCKRGRYEVHTDSIH